MYIYIYNEGFPLVRDRHDSPKHPQLLKSTCVRQVALDK